MRTLPAGHPGDPQRPSHASRGGDDSTVGTRRPARGGTRDARRARHRFPPRDNLARRVPSAGGRPGQRPPRGYGQRTTGRAGRKYDTGSYEHWRFDTGRFDTGGYKFGGTARTPGRGRGQRSVRVAARARERTRPSAVSAGCRLGRRDKPEEIWPDDGVSDEDTGHSVAAETAAARDQLGPGLRGERRSWAGRDSRARPGG